MSIARSWKRDLNCEILLNIWKNLKSFRLLHRVTYGTLQL